MNASGAGRHGWATTNSANLYGDGGVCVCVRASVCAKRNSWGGASCSVVVQTNRGGKGWG